METQKIINLLNDSSNCPSRHVIDSETKDEYKKENPILFITDLIKSGFCDYSDAHILVTGDITVASSNANTKVAFKNCKPFKTCRTKINDVFVDNADYIYIAMHMYNLIEYNDNYSNTSGSLWQFEQMK